MAEGIDVVGLFGGEPVGAAAAEALAAADLVVGGRDQVEALARSRPAVVLQEVGIAGALDAVAAAPGRVCVLASGDPGFFGIVRALAARFGRGALIVHPAPSAVSLAFARLGLPWDDAAVISVHGRPLGTAVEDVATALAAGTTVAVLTEPASPPEVVGAALVGRRAQVDRVVVCAQLGEPGEAVVELDLADLAGGTWPHRSVVVLLATGEIDPKPTVARALAVESFAHRAGMITKPEARAVALARLDLPDVGVLWDVGAGSGAVGIEAALARPGLRVLAVERSLADAERVEVNAGRYGALVEVVRGEAPEVLDHLPDPDRVFVGGGGVDVLDAVLARIRPGGRVVMSCARLDVATMAHDRLGNLVQLSVSRGMPLAGGVRLAPDNPILLAWGPE